jgi:hypothetical protein
MPCKRKGGERMRKREKGEENLKLKYLIASRVIF